jgi:hypothetical protein
MRCTKTLRVVDSSESEQDKSSKRSKTGTSMTARQDDSSCNKPNRHVTTSHQDGDDMDHSTEAPRSHRRMPPGLQTDALTIIGSDGFGEVANPNDEVHRGLFTFSLRHYTKLIHQHRILWTLMTITTKPP